METIPHWIAGEASESQARFDVFDPSTTEVYAQAPNGGAAEIDQAVDVAWQAYDTQWSTLTVDQRGELLDNVAHNLERHFDELGRVESRDTGKPISITRGGEAPGTAAEIAFYAAAVRGLRDALHSGRSSGFGLTLHQPYGVVGLIVPYNAPLMVMAEKVGQVLAAGNCAVVKPSPLAPASPAALARALSDAGLPPGVLNVVQGIGEEAGRALCEHPRVPRISFTGSTRVGQSVVQSGAAQLKHVTLELSGKSPCLVFPDANLEDACANALLSAFLYTGQICTSGSRILVHDDVAVEFRERFVKGAAALRIGLPSDPETNLGPLISAEHREAIRRVIATGKAECEVLYDGVVPGGLRGWYEAPHVFAPPSPDHPLMQNELFGPVTCITTFSDDDEALRIANNTRYGLASFVWTNDFRRIARFTRELEAGRVWVNTGHTIPADMTLPPWKLSGQGAEGGLEGLARSLGPRPRTGTRQRPSRPSDKP